MIVSFGGQANGDTADYYGQQQPTSDPDGSKTYLAFKSVVDAYSLQIIDFDIEHFYETPTMYATRHLALLQLKKDYPTLKIHFTLAADWQGGLSDDNKSMLQDAATKGLQIDVVNLMVMDFGAGSNAPHQIAQYWGDYVKQPPSKMYPNSQNTPNTPCPSQFANNTHPVNPSTYTAYFPYYYMPWCSASAAQTAYGQIYAIFSKSKQISIPSIGLTPMIGLNDGDASINNGGTANMCYQLSDAQELLSYAQDPATYIKEQITNGYTLLPSSTDGSSNAGTPAPVTRISMWSLNRDNTSSGNPLPSIIQEDTLPTNSYVNQNQWDFIKTFQPFTSTSQ